MFLLLVYACCARPTSVPEASIHILPKSATVQDCFYPPLQVSQAVNAWREMPTAAEAAESAGGSRPSQDIRRTVGVPGVTTVNAEERPSPASASKPSTSTAAAAEDDDDEDEIEVLKEQSLDEVLEVRSFFHCATMGFTLLFSKMVMLHVVH